MRQSWITPLAEKTDSVIQMASRISEARQALEYTSRGVQLVDWAVEVGLLDRVESEDELLMLLPFLNYGSDYWSGSTKLMQARGSSRPIFKADLVKDEENSVIQKTKQFTEAMKMTTMKGG